MSFGPLVRMARAWLAEPDRARLEALVAGGRDAGLAVPEERRSDWEKLLGGLSSAETDEERTRARVEGYVRACTLFEKKRRSEKQREARAARPPKPPEVPTPFDPV